MNAHKFKARNSGPSEHRHSSGTITAHRNSGRSRSRLNNWFFELADYPERCRDIKTYWPKISELRLTPHQLVNALACVGYAVLHNRTNPDLAFAKEYVASHMDSWTRLAILAMDYWTPSDFANGFGAWSLIDVEPSPRFLANWQTIARSHNVTFSEEDLDVMVKAAKKLGIPLPERAKSQVQLRDQSRATAHPV